MDSITKISLAAISALSIIGAVVCGALSIPELATALIGLAGTAVGALGGISIQSKLGGE
jgi:hypothetical protein